jgi:N-acetyl-gamma-glutamyl-phosphate reductase
MVSYLPGATLDRFVFTPHLIPISRGIINTIVVRHDERAAIAGILADTYNGSPFIRLFTDHMPHVPRSHFFLTLPYRDRDGARPRTVSAIDNLGKGAAGQALQNLRLMLENSA